MQHPPLRVFGVGGVAFSVWHIYLFCRLITGYKPVLHLFFFDL